MIHLPMLKPRHLILFILVVLLVWSEAALAQTNVLDSDPITARKRLVYSQVGGFVGFGLMSQSGTFKTACDCEFSGGSGVGMFAGFMFERLTRSQITYGVTLGYDGRGITGRFREVEGVVQTTPSGRSFTVPVTFLNEAQLALNVVSAMPYVKYHFFDLFYGRLGASVGYVFSSSLSHTKTLETDSVTFPNGEVAAVSLLGTSERSVILEEGPVPDLSALQIGIMFGVGMELRISKKMFLSPVIEYVLPISTISVQGTSFSIRSVHFSLEARHIL